MVWFRRGIWLLPPKQMLLLFLIHDNCVFPSSPSPSVLDRLNPVLEPNGVLSVDERGVVGGTIPTIVPHPNFRSVIKCVCGCLFHSAVLCMLCGDCGSYLQPQAPILISIGLNTFPMNIVTVSSVDTVGPPIDDARKLRHILECTVTLTLVVS